MATFEGVRWEGCVYLVCDVDVTIPGPFGEQCVRI